MSLAASYSRYNACRFWYCTSGTGKEPECRMLVATTLLFDKWQRGGGVGLDSTMRHTFVASNLPVSAQLQLHYHWNIAQQWKSLLLWVYGFSFMSLKINLMSNYKHKTTRAELKSGPSLIWILLIALMIGCDIQKTGLILNRHYPRIPESN